MQVVQATLIMEIGRNVKIPEPIKPSSNGNYKTGEGGTGGSTGKPCPQPGDPGKRAQPPPVYANLLTLDVGYGG
jgi:hypothetical protein